MFNRSKPSAPATQSHAHRPVTEAQVIENLIASSEAGNVKWTGVTQDRLYTLTADGSSHVCFKKPQRLIQLSQGPDLMWSADVCVILSDQQTQRLADAIGDVADPDRDDEYYAGVREKLLTRAALAYED